MGKSKQVGNKHLYLGTSKIPKRMDTIEENIDTNIWKKDDERLYKKLEEARKEMEEKDISNSVKKDTYNLQSFSYTIFAKGKKGYGR